MLIWMKGKRKGNHPFLSHPPIPKIRWINGRTITFEALGSVNLGFTFQCFAYLPALLPPLLCNENLCREREVLGPLLTPLMTQRVPDVLGTLSGVEKCYKLVPPAQGWGSGINCCKDFNVTLLCLLSPLQSPELKDWEWLGCDKTAADFPGDEGSFLAGQPEWK